MGFNRSVVHGDIGENFVTNLLKSFDFSVKKDFDLTNPAKHDIICQIGRVSFTGEIKYDIMSSKTNNIAIEVFNPKLNKPSGLYASEANIWFHLIPDGSNITCWINSISNLKTFVETTKPKKVIEIGGDKNAKLLLYSMESILDVALMRFENLEKSKAKKLVRSLL